MAFKFVVLAAFVAIAHAGIAPLAQPIATPLAAAPLLHAAPIAAAPLLRSGPILHAAPIAHAAPVAYAAAAPIAKTVVSDEYDPNPQYSFGYDVQDGLTGDSKSQVESRNGDVVQGAYSVVDPDGTKRTVEYTADPLNGFNAVVHKEPLIAAAPIAKTVVAAPAIAKVHAAPLAYAAPVAKFATPFAVVH